MSARKWVDLECDGGCGNVHGDFDSIVEARQDAKENGWRAIFVNNVLSDFCPDCEHQE